MGPSFGTSWTAAGDLHAQHGKRLGILRRQWAGAGLRLLKSPALRGAFCGRALLLCLFSYADVLLLLLLLELRLRAAFIFLSNGFFGSGRALGFVPLKDGLHFCRKALYSLRCLSCLSCR